MGRASIGVDIVQIDRFRQYNYSSHQRFYERVFTPKEIAYCLSHEKPAPHFAANFAGKEAVYKAINRFCDIKLRDIEILRDKKGSPNVILYPSSQTTNIITNSVLDVGVSLSHSSEYAVAFAISNSQPLDGE